MLLTRGKDRDARFSNLQNQNQNSSHLLKFCWQELDYMTRMTNVVSRGPMKHNFPWAGIFLVTNFIQRKVRKGFSEQQPFLLKRCYQYKLKYLFSVRNLNDLVYRGLQRKLKQFQVKIILALKMPYSPLSLYLYPLNIFKTKFYLQL